MIRFLNVYYPTRTVILLSARPVSSAAVFSPQPGSMLGDQATFVLQLNYGALKIAIITIVSLILSYYFDLYEPSIVSGRLEIYFRILLVLGFDCFILSAFFFCSTRMLRSARMSTCSASVCCAALILLRRGYEWVISWPQVFRERITFSGPETMHAPSWTLFAAVRTLAWRWSTGRMCRWSRPSERRSGSNRSTKSPRPNCRYTASSLRWRAGAASSRCRSCSPCAFRG